MRRLSLATVVLSLAAATLFVPAAPASGDEILPGIYSLRGIDAGLPKGDLQPLREIVGDATVVALGESTHTSGGFSRLKYRVFRYLVEEMGFRAFAFESPWERAESVAAYVETCQGTPEEAIKGLFGVWQNQSVRDLTKWMCAWNRRHPDDPVHFLGFDEQQPDLDYAALREHLRRFRLPDRDPRVRGLESCSRRLEQRVIQEADFLECTGSLDQLGRYIDRRQAVLAHRTSAAEVEFARIRLVGLRAWQEQTYYRWRDSRRGVAARDAAMAYIFLKRREVEFPAAKMVIWAANFHIDEDNLSTFGHPTMGDHLAAALGNDYVTLALVAYVIGIDWPGVGCGETVLPYPFDSVESLLHGLGEPYLLVDLDFPGTSAPFLDHGRQYSLGLEYEVPREHYDGIFFLDHSPMMVPVNRPPCE